MQYSRRRGVTPPTSSLSSRTLVSVSERSNNYILETTASHRRSRAQMCDHSFITHMFCMIYNSCESNCFTTNLGGVVCRSFAGSVQCKMCFATPLPLLLPECQ